MWWQRTDFFVTGMYMYILLCQGNVHVHPIYYARVMYMYILLCQGNVHVYPRYYARVMYMYILLRQGYIHVHHIMYVLLCASYYVRPIISIPFSKFMVAGSGSKNACMRLRESNTWITVRITILYTYWSIKRCSMKSFFFKWTNVDSFLRILLLCFGTMTTATANAIHHDFMKKGLNHFTLRSMERWNILLHHSILHHELVWRPQIEQVAFV